MTMKCYKAVFHQKRLKGPIIVYTCKQVYVFLTSRLFTVNCHFRYLQIVAEMS